MIVSFSLFILPSCSSKDVLLILNWGEYISDEVVEKFEEEYNCTVKLSLADSNELFYSKVKSGTTVYDLVVPSDYMIQKMYEKDLLEELDLSKIPNYNKEMFLPGVIGIESEMFEGNERYQIPYFWGTFGLMYNKQKAGLEEIVLSKGWDAYFNKDLPPNGTRCGMYGVARFSYAACMFYNNLSPNEITDETLKVYESTLRKAGFTEWGTDTLKKSIVSNNLDLAFVYTGDCLDMLYTKLDEENVTLEDITFDIYIPDNTIAFMDSLVMLKDARHKELAYKFMNFMLETENAYMNASVVGYCTPLKASYEQIVNYVGDDAWLNNWSYAMKTYYPLPKESEKQYKGVPLTNFSKDSLTAINNIVNTVKSVR